MKNFDIDDINIIFEDNHILVVVKPQNVPACPDETGDKDMVSLLKEYLIKKYDKKGDAFLGLVHRLDRPTGGVMVFAKTSKAARRLSEELRNNEIEKRYFTIVHGTPKEKQGELVHYLFKDTAKNMVYTVPMATEGAKKAVLDYKVLLTNDKMSLVDIRLITGRSHQIRVQMSAIGTPLFGDQKYAEGRTMPGVNIALWATELKFFHPITREKLVYRVYPPVDDIPWKYFDVNRFLAINIKY
jgi:23S rRNA pseudouridine1911/1915/1917 synthase